ncbi:unnamed protein product [Periconia digitata]|uniref:RNA 3'-terminal phosphate cyclase domain-containing protein n=1 Tax=Periconia digitata TaxID=1303443 RepID=A0A9W4URD0_9PLEO|nr:unnamed protein product [Periconia digitata]
MRDIIHLPGTTLEGGGQLLRLATCLASLTSTPIHITSIRGNRSGGGGLKSQHLTSIQWLAKASHARVRGMGLKSKEITFEPSPHKSGVNMSLWDATGGDITIKQTTPGSVNLILQAILPYILFASTSTDPVRIRITGGTNVSNSPSCDYIEQVLFPMLALIGIPPITTKLHSRGWSQGGTTLGSVTYTVTPLPSPPSPPPEPQHNDDEPSKQRSSPARAGKLPAFTLTTRGTITSIHATILAPSAHQQAFESHLHTVLTSSSFQASLHPESSSSSFSSTLPDPNSTSPLPPPPIPITITSSPSHHEKRFYLLLVATTSTGIKLGHDHLFSSRLRPDTNIQRDVIESTAEKTIQGLVREVRSGACVDEWMRDQIVVFQALAQGRSVVDGGGDREASLHARTAEWVAERMLGVRFEGGGGCVGVGYRGGWGEEVDGVAEGLARLAV